MFLFRYVELNTKLHAGYRRYSPTIPDYLKERPHHIIKHCLERLSLSEEIPNSCVSVISMKEGIFKVGSKSAKYKVSFGDEADESSQLGCECIDWEKHRLPCKHFFAVFRNFPPWSFERLPNSYKTSPFLSLDRELLLRDSTAENYDESHHDELPDDHAPTVNLESPVTQSVSCSPHKKFRKLDQDQEQVLPSVASSWARLKI
jgi:hedgehog interacting protein